MAGRKAVARGKAKGKGKASSSVPDIYQDMLAEALPTHSKIPERPLKRRRVGERSRIDTSSSAVKKPNEQQSDGDDDDEVEFEDVLGQIRAASSEDESDAQAKIQQTAFRSSDEDSEADFDWDTFDFSTKPQVEPSGDLELTLKARPAPLRKIAPRRKLVTKEERALRLQIHKMHVLCLLAYVDKRNEWCNDSEVQASLKPLLTKKMMTFLNPSEGLTQFGQAESLKRGLEDVNKLWRAKFKITTRGMRRALWADDENDLQNVSLSMFPQDSFVDPI